MTDVEVYQPQAVTPVSGNELDVMVRQADMLAVSSIIPKDYRRQPANILVAAMTGRTFGWDVMTAMRNGHVIEGVWALRPEAMLGLIRRAGHSVTGSMSPTVAKIHGKRCDNGDELGVEFSVGDAVTAGLCQVKDGKPYARSSSGKKLPWEQYPQSMCWWRAVAILARGLFSDVTLGMSYTPEELGATVDENGEILDAPSQPAALAPVEESPYVSEANARLLREQCVERGIKAEQVVALATDGRTDDPCQVLKTEITAVRDARDRVAEMAMADDMDDADTDDDIAEAEVVYEPGEEPM